MAPFWHAAGNMVTAHAYHSATLLANGKVLVAGGVINDRLDGWVLASAELYDPDSGAWTAIADMIEARWRHTATLLPDGRVLVAGSYINSGESRTSAELYDPGTGSWTATPSMRQGRGGHTATLLLDGRVLIAGGDSGYVDVGESSGPLVSAELYDPRSGSWTATGDMATARDRHTATLLPDGRVLIAGGAGDGAPASAELYEPSTGRWTVTGAMATGRSDHTGTLLADGTVLVAGGYLDGSDTCCPSSRTAEVYDQETGRWTATGEMIEARAEHAATRLADGRLIVAGGRGNSASDYGLLATAELYDRESGRWTATERMAEARDGHTATLLRDGRVLLAGDYNNESLASAELYDPNNGI